MRFQKRGPGGKLVLIIKEPKLQIIMEMIYNE
jgi:hypothetical protein